MKYFIFALMLSFFSLPGYSQSWQFEKKIGGQRNQSSSGAAIDQYGNSYIIGSFKGTITLDTILLVGGSSGNVFVAKYNSMGNIIWAVFRFKNFDKFRRHRYIYCCSFRPSTKRKRNLPGSRTFRLFS